ncbi:TetR/AcrR family transcriptional regulator, partial [Klebsiella pneumoniae]|uniref:TetR/AcrR family transcriptional regulator n=1 Tax=Klebsiella pneumoniae TaxID=573 RepID=UPI000E20B017
MHIDVDDKHVVRAFVDCIAESGVTEMTADDVARRLGSSRAGLYRQFGSWPQMVLFGYEAMLEWIDSQIPEPGGDRRVELETWWSSLVRLFGSPLGQALLAMRSLAELHSGARELEELE